MNNPNQPPFGNHQGLSTRGYIATQVLAGILAGDTYEKGFSEQIAIDAADELIARLNAGIKPQQEPIVPRGPKDFTRDDQQYR